MTASSRKPHPLEGTRVSGWWAVVNKFAQVSEVYAMKMYAEGALANRGDSASCTLVEVEIVIKAVVPRTRKS